MNNKEGNPEESFYLCESIWLDRDKKMLIDIEFPSPKLLNIDNIDDCIVIIEREIREWLLNPMILLINNDLENKLNYRPFKNSIFALYGIFSYIEKMQRFREGKPYSSGDTNSTKILTQGFKRLFPDNKQNNYGNQKIEQILKNTRHSLMHFGNIGDKVLINNDYENSVPVVYYGSNKNLDKLEINPLKMIETIINDFNSYLKELREENNSETRENFMKVFEFYYADEISILQSKDNKA